MKRRYLVIGMLAAALKGTPQSIDTSYQKREVPKTNIELVYSQYNQDGDHSAITGGIGTEKLSVYAPGFILSHTSGKNSYSLSAGGDVISSASTDNIDFEESSASRVETRIHANINYSRQVGNSIWGLGSGFSMESDYLSIPVFLSFDYAEPGGMRKYYVHLQAFFDDLYWGRGLTASHRHPLQLIYPEELRYKEWYDEHNRYSFNVRTGIIQVINKRLIAGLYPEFIYQQGLLATPYHRVYFTDDDSAKVENFPKEKFRFPIGIKVNYFAGSRTILKAFYGFYTDNFGVTGNSLELETSVKATSKLTLSPFIRFNQQSASDYFQPFGQHDPMAGFYTSDYDLSNFNSVKAGIGLRYAPYKYFSKRNLFDEVLFRYAFFKRSDQLTSHMFTVSFVFSREGKSTKGK